MTPEEISELKSFGLTTQANLASYLTTTLLHGMFVLLFTMSTVSIVKRGLKTRASLAMLAVTVFSFLLSTLYWAASTAVFAILVQNATVTNTELPLGARIGQGFVASLSPTFITIWTSLITPILSDMVVFWRAWVLYPQQRWVMILPAMLLLGTTGVSIAFLGLAKDASGLVTTNNPELFNNLLLSSVILSMSTNAILTLLIGYKLWTHRKVLNNIGKKRRRSYVERILVVFIETGIFYCGLQIAALILNFVHPLPGTPSLYAEQVVYAIYTEVSGMYPTIVVVLVNHHRSFVDTFGLPTGHGYKEEHISHSRTSTGISRPLSFAVAPTETTTDNDPSATVRSGNDVESRISEKTDDAAFNNGSLKKSL